MCVCLCCVCVSAVCVGPVCVSVCASAWGWGGLVCLHFGACLPVCWWLLACVEAVYLVPSQGMVERKGPRVGEGCAGGLAGPCWPWVSFLADLSQAPQVPASAALPSPVGSEEASSVECVWWPRARLGLAPPAAGQWGGVLRCCLHGGEPRAPSCPRPRPQPHALLSPWLGDSCSGHAVVS